mgnify:CR=1 FL=1
MRTVDPDETENNAIGFVEVGYVRNMPLYAAGPESNASTRRNTAEEFSEICIMTDMPMWSPQPPKSLICSKTTAEPRSTSNRPATRWQNLPAD